MGNTSKNLAPKPNYVSPKQLVLEGFESPFHKNLNPNNRWVKLRNMIPWDDLVSIYRKTFPEKVMGRPDLSPQMVLGAIIIKHLCDLDDRETVDQISENVYMQYFLGYSSFCDVPPFSPSLFVEFRKRLGVEQINAINERIAMIKRDILSKQAGKSSDSDDENGNSAANENSGSLIIDATACPQDIAYPTDLDLLNAAREKSEELMDIAFAESSLKIKPRNYRELARKDYLHTAQKKSKSRKEIRQALRKQLG